MHTRTIHCEGFRRDDGLWDIEARIVDMKTFAYHEPIRGDRKAGDRVHDMIVRLTITDDLEVRDVQVAMPATPYPTCQQAMPAYQGLIGKRIGQGWRRAVLECVGGTKCCTHVRELLFPMATATYCDGQITGKHVRGRDKFIKRRYASRIKALQYRYKDAAGLPQGGVYVSDGLQARKSDLLFQFSA